MVDNQKIYFFYNTVTEIVEKGINENKYFYNSSIFKGNQKDELINNVMEEYIFNACIEFFSTVEGPKLYAHFINESYSDISRVYVVKEIVRIATLSYYKDKFEETGSIDINMDIRCLNISDCTINNLKKKLFITDNVVRLKDIMNITYDDFLDWNFNGGSNKKEIKDLVVFCSDIYSAFIDNESVISENLNNKELLIKIKSLEEKYSAIQTRKQELQREEQDVLNSIKKLKNELFEINSVEEEAYFQRKR